MPTESRVRSTSPASIVEVWYGDHKLVPAPFISWVVESQHDGNTKVRTVQTTRLTLEGTFVDLPDGTYERMFEYQESLRSMFSVDAQEFKIVAGAGNTNLASGTVIKDGIYPQITNVNVKPDIQHNVIDYTVDMLESVASVSGQAVENMSDSWELSENDEDCYIDVTHTVSAKGINTLASGTDAIDNARAAVSPRLGTTNIPYYLPEYTEPSGGGSPGASRTNIYEVTVSRREASDILAGTYSVTEQFAIVSGTAPYIHNNQNSFEENENGVATVTLRGTIKGLGRTNNNPSGGIGFDRALAGYNTLKENFPVEASGIYSLYKENASNFYLFTTNSLGMSVAENRCVGTIQYSISYTDDPGENLPSGITEATTSVQRNEAIRLFASHPIIFRRLGNIVQDIKTTVEGRITINSSATAENTGDSTVDTNRAIAYVQSEINRLRPNSADYQDLRVGGVDETFNDKELSAQASATYIFVTDLSSVSDADSDIVLTTL